MMKLVRGFLLVMAALAGAGAGVGASAATYVFSVTSAPGSTDPFPTFAFQLASAPLPDADFGYGFTVAGVATSGTSQYGPVSYGADYSFYKGDGIGAGFDDGTADHSYFSSQLFTGDTSAPTFKLGSFALYGDPDGPVVATLVIADAAEASSVPEPGAWGMMIAGLGMVGGMLRRDRAGYGSLLAEADSRDRPYWVRWTRNRSGPVPSRCPDRSPAPSCETLDSRRCVSSIPTSQLDPGLRRGTSLFEGEPLFEGEHP